MLPFLFKLDEVKILMFPPSDTGLEKAFVVQVHIVTSNGNPSVHTLATYYDAQEEVTDLILIIVGAHIRAPLHTPVKVEFDAPDYTLYAETREWKAGKSIKLAWGEDPVTMAEDKWTFTFRTKPAYDGRE
ncbi:hypothetical protein JAAARDRAFT_670556 [Jaapia argillacea MUCL 33604]|uniref:Uncharacterized protein n=1 Tax=Jaapia argillacea MUCL 33604 TaxID=933084 RepID=A0A067PUL2_9AGAM|nr:hypothetical protein JAAARDRAFT_670556 [Jaapia argillacea MUCL 33604]